ncbi:nuclease-related domain-containing protein [Sporosarcina sp. HYO08]|uniref:nuclease-related domain-containing protein n=1 Tax=Sporosarcina sp. HYO08 TaxID=1759557 RepID=UPI00079A0694|nr:nuclease-related domain-containing protein [Sporosarcina sp. HYO08]KXH87149.1 hypothetical protein AU377_00820 [Sporosarcina sp. HYO08]
MAQLVKLLDYVSRYENDLSRYPTQYIRLKQYQWERLKKQWENGLDLSEWKRPAVQEEVQEEKRSFLSRFWVRRKKEPEEQETGTDEQEDDFGFTLQFAHEPKDLQQLRKVYLQQLFQYQLKWASSTLMESSPIDPRFYRDPLLRSFLEKLPDNLLLFYYPIVVPKKAPIELDILLLTPIECLCITVLDKENDASFIGSGERFWMKRWGEIESKVLNPIISLNRMERVVEGLFRQQEIDFPIRKVLISPNGFVDYPNAPFDVTIIDKRSYEAWFNAIRKTSIPMKFKQFKAAQTILDTGQTTSRSLFALKDE